MSLRDLQGDTIALANRITSAADADDLTVAQRDHVMAAASVMDIATARLHQAQLLGRGPMRQAPETQVSTLDDVGTAIRRDTEES